MRLIHLLIILAFLIVLPLSGEEMTRFEPVKNDISTYKDRRITMMLRLKYHDRLFEKLIFYDADNRDIEFDINRKKISREMRKDLLNLHEGLMYRVTFTVTGKGKLGMLTGTIERAVPLVLEKLP